MFEKALWKLKSTKHNKNRILLKKIFEINHATSSNLYRSYYPHRSRELVSPVCGIFHKGLGPTDRCLELLWAAKKRVASLEADSSPANPTTDSGTDTHLLFYDDQIFGCIGNKRNIIIRQNPALFDAINYVNFKSFQIYDSMQFCPPVLSWNKPLKRLKTNM